MKFVNINLASVKPRGFAILCGCNYLRFQVNAFTLQIPSSTTARRRLVKNGHAQFLESVKTDFRSSSSSHSSSMLKLPIYNPEPELYQKLNFMAFQLIIYQLQLRTIEL